jgi:hypothetical protein
VSDWRDSPALIPKGRRAFGWPCPPVVQRITPQGQIHIRRSCDVWLRRWSRQFQHEIAAAYVINWGRVNDALNEVTHVGSKEKAAKRVGRTV